MHLWEALATRYRDRPEVAGYNPINEPSDPLGTRLVPFYERLEKAVRAIDPFNAVLLNAEALRSMGAGEPQRALQQLTVALTHHPDDAWALALRAQLYQLLGQPDKARADNAALARLVPGFRFPRD